MRWTTIWVTLTLTLDAICPAFVLVEKAFLRLNAAVAGLVFLTSFEVAKREIDFAIML
jgi:hypothetical protein